MSIGNLDPIVESAQAVRRRIRAAEFQSVADFFTPGQRVLDYGAGGGFMSSLIAARGCAVEAIDMETRPWK